MTIRWGILGAAKFAREQMGPAIHMARGHELTAVARRSGPVEGFEFADPRGVEGYETLLADDGIDAVYIPLPNSEHVEWAVKAAEAGKHVLVEKPCAMDVAGVDALIEARNRTEVMIAEAYMIVHHPQWRRAREIVQGGELGELVQIEAFFSFDNRDMGNIRNKPEMGGGAMRDIGVYTFGGPRFATGAEIEVEWADIAWENDVDVVTRVAGRLAGASYLAMVSTRAALRQEVTFHGTKGVLRLPVPFNARVFGEPRVVLSRGMETIETRYPTDEQYVLQVEAFGSAIGGEDYACPLEFSRGTQAVIDRVLEMA